MARQKGVIKFSGQVGDLSFYKTKEGFFVRQNGGIDGDRIKNDPGFVRCTKMVLSSVAQVQRVNYCGRLCAHCW